MRKPLSARRRTGASRSSWASLVATRNVTVTDDPANLVSTHALSIGTMYALQNIDPSTPVYLRVAAVKPSRTMPAHVIPPFEFGYPRPESTTGIWIWCDPKHSPARAVITEAS